MTKSFISTHHSKMASKIELTLIDLGDSGSDSVNFLTTLDCEVWSTLNYSLKEFESSSSEREV